MKSFITYLTEKKDHIIKRLKNLTDDEKEQVIAFFSKKPNLENQIDWHNRELTFKNFEQVMDTSKTERRRAVKKQGIAGLKVGKDFLELKLPDELTFSAYIPLHHEASRLIASNKIGGVEGKWCISANSDFQWKKYIYRDNLIPVMFVDYEEKDKYALMLDGNDLSFDSLWDKVDKSLGQRGVAGLGISSDVYNEMKSNNVVTLRKARTLLDKNKPKHWFDAGILNGTLRVSNINYKINDERLEWKDGIWESGTWEDGRWEDGTWWNGTWKGGRWEMGTWEKGVWKYGTWEKGTWKGGTWKYGSWYAGIWKFGVWKGGRWEAGTWEDGIWEKGIWWSGTWVKGLWRDGTWKDGTWKKGIWENGDWQKGLWKDGVWEKGAWWGGTWLGGTWENGRWWMGKWEGGTWKDGIWEDGTWQGGKWLGGTWKGGYDKNGDFHEEGDSPDKWTLK